jgi:hypothetical protein
MSADNGIRETGKVVQVLDDAAPRSGWANNEKPDEVAFDLYGAGSYVQWRKTWRANFANGLLPRGNNEASFWWLLILRGAGCEKRTKEKNEKKLNELDKDKASTGTALLLLLLEENQKKSEVRTKKEKRKSKNKS